MNSWDEYLRSVSEKRTRVRKAYKLGADRMESIKSYSGTRRILYPEMKDAFDYVHAIYPFANVKQAIVYHVSKAMLNKVGYSGVGGFYDSVLRVICVTDHVVQEDEYGVTAEYTLDEVLCHELIHYGANFKNALSSRAVEEEIAYGKTVNYLLSRGRTPDFIIKRNMLPYLMSIVDKKEVYRKVLTAKYDEAMLVKVSSETINTLVKQEQKTIIEGIKAEAYSIGKRMIDLYGDTPVIAKAVKPTFRRLDLGDDL